MGMQKSAGLPSGNEYFSRLMEEGRELELVQTALSALAHHGVGLGEVICDYAGQASTQFNAFLKSCQHLACGVVSERDVTALQMAHSFLHSVASVLSMAPEAMARNKMNVVGEYAKFSRHDIVRIARSFRENKYIAPLLASESACQALYKQASDYFLSGHMSEVVLPGIHEARTSSVW